MARIADVLTQLLQTEDATELAVVNSALFSLRNLDPKGWVTGIFAQINCGDDLIRERAIKFIKERFRTIAAEQLTKEVEEHFLSECRKAMEDVTKEEFVAFMALLSSLKITRTITGQQTLVDIITEQAELDAQFDVRFALNLIYFLKCDSLFSGIYLYAQTN